MVQQGRKIALVGTAPSGRFAPFNDLTWELWGVGLRANYFTRANRWYEIHRLDGEEPGWAAEWRNLMKAWSHECDIYMFYPEDIGPKIVKFDPAPLIARFGQYFMTSSFSWMMAQAMIETNVEEIGIWGVDMEYGTEYRQQRVGLRHFIEVAKILGIKVTRVSSSGIAYEPIPYPFWMDDPLMSKVQLRHKKYIEKRTEIAYSVERLANQMVRAEGAVEQFRSLLKSEAISTEMRQVIVDRVTSLDGIANDTRRTLTIERDDLKKTEGALEELDWLEDYLQP